MYVYGKQKLHETVFYRLWLYGFVVVLYKDKW